MNKKKKTILIVILIILLILILITLKAINIENIILKNIYTKQYEECIYKCSEECEIDPLLVLAIIRVESNFKKDSVSLSQAKGLMQLMDSTADELATKLNMNEDYDIFNAETNIELGTTYMSNLLTYYNNNLYLALAAYNAGIGNVNKWIEKGTIKKDGSDIENIPFKETRNYVRKVLRDYRIYSRLYG